MGCSEIVGRIVEDLKDENEPYRRMVMETIDKVVRDLGTADIDARLEELLIDGILYAFQEQVGALAFQVTLYTDVVKIIFSIDSCGALLLLLTLLTKSERMLVVQVSDDANVMLNGFGTVVNSLKMRAKPYLPQICGTIKWRLNNKNAKIRQQAADLIARIAVVMKVCSNGSLVHVFRQGPLRSYYPCMPRHRAFLLTFIERLDLLV